MSILYQHVFHLYVRLFFTLNVILRDAIFANGQPIVFPLSLTVLSSCTTPPMTIHYSNLCFARFDFKSLFKLQHSQISLSNRMQCTSMLVIILVH